MALLFPAVGMAVAVAGGDKLAGNKDYIDMFRHLGWSKVDMQAAAAAEVASGVLMALPATRRLGGVILAATSAAVLMSEVNGNQPQLAVPRAALLLAGLAAILAPRSRPKRVVYVD